MSVYDRQSEAAVAAKRTSTMDACTAVRAEAGIGLAEKSGRTQAAEGLLTLGGVEATGWMQRVGVAGWYISLGEDGSVQRS